MSLWNQWFHIQAIDSFASIYSCFSQVFVVSRLRMQLLLLVALQASWLWLEASCAQSAIV